MTPRVRDTEGRALKVALTDYELKRLDALFQAKALVSEMAQGQRMLEKLVITARKNGATWAEIGAVAGITAQSAHQRWSPKNARHAASRVPGKQRLPVKREVQQSLAV